MPLHDLVSARSEIEIYLAEPRAAKTTRAGLERNLKHQRFPFAGRHCLSAVAALSCLIGSSAVVGIGATAPLTAASAKDSAEPTTPGGPTSLRRLNENQYKRSIEDIFGNGIKVPGRFDPPLREAGLLAIGDSKVAVSASGFEQYELRAREIAAQVLAADKRAEFVGCTPADAAKFDRKCASSFLNAYGLRLFRRPLTSLELASAVNLSAAATLKVGDFYRGMEAGLAQLLASPNFIFRVERNVSRGGKLHLDDYSLATRVSFLLWDAPPDEQLLAAAGAGSLRTPEGLQREVDRLIASPRFAQGVRGFFSDMFGYDQFEGLTKDQSIYPKYTSKLAADAQEQTLRTIVDHLVTNRSDYRDLFTTKKTFMNRNLGSLYQVPVSGFGPDGWRPYEFRDGDPRGGILTLAAFLMLDPTHEGRSSPTIRGKYVRELFLCQLVPLPPNNVDFTIVQNTGDMVHKTARERLTIHQENPACAGCHAITDPIGLSMENFDAVGAFRTHENGAVIDASGEFEGKPYSNALSLQRLLRDSEAAPSCMVKRAFEYGVGRPINAGEEKWLEYTIERFAQDRFQFPALMRRIALSSAFQAVAFEKIALN